MANTSVRSGGHSLDWGNRPLPYKIYPGAGTLALPRDLSLSAISTLSVLRQQSRSPQRPLDLETLTRLVCHGAYAEFGYCTVSPMWNHAPVARVVEAIKALGAEHCILMSDGGQRHNPMPAECLRVFAQCVRRLSRCSSALPLRPVLRLRFDL